VQIHKVQIEEKKVDREAKIEKERDRKEDPKAAAESFFHQPRDRVPPVGRNGSRARSSAPGMK
jgi:hypothetical protein